MVIDFKNKQMKRNKLIKDASTESESSKNSSHDDSETTEASPRLTFLLNYYVKWI